MKSVLLVFALIIICIFSASFTLRRKRASAEESGRLFLPESFEQYLPLSTPAGIALSESYIAVADDNVLFIYDRAAERYERYEHTYTSANYKSIITGLQISSDGNLYFSDQHGKLFYFDFKTRTAEEQSSLSSCFAFVVSGNTLYLASVALNMTTIYAIPDQGNGKLGTPKQVATIDSMNTTPCMFVYEGSLSCAVGNRIYIYTESEGEYLGTEKLFSGEHPISNLGSVCVFQEEVYFTVNASRTEANGLYRTDFSSDCELILPGNNFRTLSTYNDSLFCVTGSTVRELQLGESGIPNFTGYEIGSASSSYNRLSGATQIVRAGNLIVTADCGNERVSVYDTEKESFTLLPCGVASAVATDGNLIAAGVDSEILLYRKGETQPFYTHTASEKIVGLAVVYNRCYYVTASACGEAAEGNREIKRLNYSTGLTSDFYGNLYVSDAEKNVTKYTETEFTDISAEGTLLPWTLPDGATSLRADYMGNIYCLSGGSIFRNGIQVSDALGEELVCDAKPAVSLALGFEDRGVYLLHSDYVVYTTALEVANLSQIKTGNVFDSIKKAPSHEELTLCDVPTGTEGIRIDLSKLSAESESFAYLGYLRSVGGRGVLLGSTKDFALVALYENHDYQTLLIPTEVSINVPLAWEEKTPTTVYLTNDVALSRYPCILDALTVQTLYRLSSVTLLAEIRSEEDKGFDFGYVELKDGTRGYVPLSYLTESQPLDTEPEAYRLGYLKKNADGVTFRAENGETFVVRERTQVKIFESEDGRYLVSLTRNGVDYTAQVTRSMIETGNPTTLRISMIIILCVVAVGILAAYTLLIPKKKRS